MNEKTMIVTGGAGFIGSTFVAQMVERGFHVVVLDALTYAGHEENLTWIAPKNGGKYELVKGDIRDGALAKKLFDQYQPKFFINFAAESHVDNSIERPSEFIETNIIGCYTLLEAARGYWNALPESDKKTFRFLHVSTDEVYGSLGETGKFSETTPMQPNSPYSASKAAGDHLCRAWFHTYGLPTIVTNCSNNYGPRQFPEKLIPRMITQALKGEALPIYGDGKNIRDWIHVEDHCRGIQLALEKGTPGETYCFGGNAEKTNLDVVDTICTTLDAERPRNDGSYKELKKFVQDRAGHDRRYAIDDTKAEKELGFKRAYDFTTGIQQTIAWYLAHTDWCNAVTTKKAA